MSQAASYDSSERGKEKSGKSIEIEANLMQARGQKGQETNKARPVTAAQWHGQVQDAKKQDKETAQAQAQAEDKEEKQTDSENCFGDGAQGDDCLILKRKNAETSNEQGNKVTTRTTRRTFGSIKVTTRELQKPQGQGRHSNPKGTVSFEVGIIVDKYCCGAGRDIHRERLRTSTDRVSLQG